MIVWLLLSTKPLEAGSAATSMVLNEYYFCHAGYTCLCKHDMMQSQPTDQITFAWKRLPKSERNQ